MLQITYQSGRDGPFASVEADADAYRVVSLTGAPGVLPKSVVGVGVVEPWVGDIPGPPPPAPPVVPQAINPWQAKSALLAAGLLAEVEERIANLPEDLAGNQVRLDWSTAQTFRRDWPALNALAADIGLDSKKLDALFVYAAAL